MIKNLCSDCAEIYGQRFELHVELKKNVKKCSCEACGTQKSCMIYTLKRKEQANAKDADGTGCV